MRSWTRRSAGSDRERPTRSPSWAAARPDPSDDDIRAAWRRIAAAIHPDRADGGDPARFAEAAAAYTMLRTVTGRREAYADLAAGAAAPGRIRRGRPAVLALRAGRCRRGQRGCAGGGRAEPATFALIAGALTWLARTGPAGTSVPGGRVSQLTERLSSGTS